MTGLTRRHIGLNDLSPYVRYIHEHNGTTFTKIPVRQIYDHEIICLTEGSLQLRTDRCEYTAEKGDLLVIPPDLPHAYEMTTCRYFAVHFDLLYMGESLDFSADDVYVNIDYQSLDKVPVEQDLVSRPIVTLAEPLIPILVQLTDPYPLFQRFRELLDLFCAKPFGHQLKLRALLLDILYHLISELVTKEGVARSHPHRSETLRAIQYMTDHYNLDFNFGTIAREVNLSPNYFRTLFKDATGKTPIEYVTMLRMEAAKKLLIDQTYNVSEISRMVGYDDIHYFSKLFKKLEGLSPKHFADTVRKGKALR